MLTTSRIGITRNAKIVRSPGDLSLSCALLRLSWGLGNCRLSLGCGIKPDSGTFARGANLAPCALLPHGRLPALASASSVSFCELGSCILNQKCLFLFLLLISQKRGMACGAARDMAINAIKLNGYKTLKSSQELSAGLGKVCKVVGNKRERAIFFLILFAFRLKWRWRRQPFRAALT